MLIILSLLFILVVGIVVWLIKRNSWDVWGIWPGIAALFLGLALLILLINRAEVTSQTLAFRATQTTMTEARNNKDISALELAAIQRDAIEKNGWLETQKYWHNNPWTSWFVPANVMKLTPIR